MIAQIQNFSKTGFITCVILFIDPFELTGFVSILFSTFLVFVSRIIYEVFLTRPMTRFFRIVKKKLFTKKIEK